MKNSTRLCREAHLQVKMHKTPHCQSRFCSSDVEKWRAAVARSTCSSQNAQNTTFAEPFWKFRCSKMARGCGAKHMCKSKCKKHHIRRGDFGSSDVQKWHAAVARSTCASQYAKNTTFAEAILEVPMFKTGTRLWREAKMLKTPGFCSILRRF